MYQSGDVAIYYLIGMGAYFWAYSEGEVRRPLHLSVEIVLTGRR